MPRIRTSRRALALLAVVVVAVVGLAVGVSPSRTTVPAPSGARPAGAGAGPGLASARQSCTGFASLVGALQRGQVGPASLASDATSIADAATSAATADRATWGRLADDATIFATAVHANDPSTSRAAQVLATDCQAVLATAPTRSS